MLQCVKDGTVSRAVCTRCLLVVEDDDSTDNFCTCSLLYMQRCESSVLAAITASFDGAPPCSMAPGGRCRTKMSGNGDD